MEGSFFAIRYNYEPEAEEQEPVVEILQKFGVRAVTHLPNSEEVAVVVRLPVEDEYSVFSDHVLLASQSFKATRFAACHIPSVVADFAE